MSNPPSRSTHPPPPAFFHLYSADVAPELREPPAPPPPGAVVAKFGALQADALAEHRLRENDDVPQLFSGADVSAELRKLNRMAAERFAGLLGALAEAPDGIEDHIDGVSAVLVNMTLLLNRCRAHQARQALVTMLRRQAEEREDRARKLEESVDNVERFLGEHGLGGQ